MIRFANATFNRNFNSRKAMVFFMLLCSVATAQALPGQATDADFVAPQAHADTHRAIDGVIHRAAQSSCLAKEQAEGEARELAIKSAKTYCRSEGFGWRAAKVKNMGNLDCHRCDDNRFRCGYSGVSLECRKAEPQLSSFLGWLSAER
jgi:hypothetical protein